MFSRSAAVVALVMLATAASHAEISTSNLSAESSSISSKAISIEQDYSDSMRVERLGMTYSSTLNMRESRKVGVGMSVGGALGLVGIAGEFNFEDENGVVAGFGTGPGYNSIQFAWKHAFEGDYIAPYYTAGYSRWYNSMGNSGSWKESSILDRVLTDDEKKSGRFGTDFLNASLGLQYNQLSGDFAGVSCFAEVVAMYEVKRSQLIPSGTVGALYYF
ncbi:hypothetical protein B9G69_008650 [Bdellovibrio sp. SKB1291214]|uniref:hypothetical protein n=1 Tax=Bdellovibrio sp. SKB1291214 TaxID=1732569 RepID=UPI00223FD555|nr:hypothetical protein [Bdellovibrio sp. SKB1291214]UYL10643.1 hypothetical protein B9G69_008650 [Bdellovibrio sp. SKB1291214]